MKTCQGILIIDDDIHIRESLKEALEYDGHSVLTASNGVEGLNTIEKNGKPAVIFLDIHMPVMDGFVFMKQMNQRDDLLNIPIILMTAAASLGGLSAPIRLLKKPFELDDALNAAKHFCCVSENNKN